MAKLEGLERLADSAEEFRPDEIISHSHLRFAIYERCVGGARNFFEVRKSYIVNRKSIWPTYTKKLISLSQSLSFTMGKILLIHHRKLNKWLPLGGHIELDEDPGTGGVFVKRRRKAAWRWNWIGERPPTTSPGTRALIAPRFLDIHRITETHEHIGMIFFSGAARKMYGK